MRTHAWLLVALVAAPILSACGEDDAPPPPPPAAPGAPPPPGPAAPGRPAGPQLQPRLQIEQKIVCAEIEKATGPACNKDAPMCDPGLYCLEVTGANKATHCEPCPERDTIRHEFKDRDFVADQVRDPFQSFVIVPTELVEKSDKTPEGPCTRKEQFVATSYSYLALQLVGIVSQGTQRKALMMGGNVGHIVRRGYCVGKEKAVVKDIGAGYVTFVVQPEDDGRGTTRPPEEHSVQLHPKTLEVAPPSEEEQGGTATQIVAPPGASKDTKDTPAPTQPPATKTDTK